MKAEEAIKELRQSAQNLLDLMTDPHPGLMTWREQVDYAIERIAEWSPNHISNREEGK